MWFTCNYYRNNLVMDTLNKILALTMTAMEKVTSSASSSNRIDLQVEVDKLLSRSFKKPLKIIFDGEDGVRTVCVLY